MKWRQITSDEALALFDYGRPLGCYRDAPDGTWRWSGVIRKSPSGCDATRHQPPEPALPRREARDLTVWYAVDD